MAKTKPAPVTTTTTLKLPNKLKSRVAKLAKKRGRSPHGFMLEAIEREIDRQERMESFIREALAADLTIEKSGEVYAAADVHAWLGRLASDGKAVRPKPWCG
jgi:predicted transcriptional regulator